MQSPYQSAFSDEGCLEEQIFTSSLGLAAKNLATDLRQISQTAKKDPAKLDRDGARTRLLRLLFWKLTWRPTHNSKF